MMSSQSKVPKAKTSTFSSYDFFAKSSGAMYAGVPLNCIVPVFKSALNLAKPKSQILMLSD